MSMYKKKEETKGPSQDSLLLKQALESIKESLPTSDTSSLEEKVAMLAEKFDKMVETSKEHHRVSQEASKSFYQEAIASLKSIANIKLEASQEVSEPVDVEALLEGMAKLIPEPAPMPAPIEPIDVEGIIRQVFELTKKQPPKYTFNIERNHSGVLVGITATPEEGR